MMEWKNLLSLDKNDTHKRYRSRQDEQRLAFEVDYDRIIFSPEFRSLQDKTQVIPLSQKDFVHTRLTHSIEVSVVGRSLGRGVGKTILERHPDLKESGYKTNDFGSIVAAASLAHDIGNPPFGHGGENAIGNYFLNEDGKILKDKLTDKSGEKKYQDLCDFEGNANGFRILTQSQNALRLTNATLGAFLKYPKESLPKKPSEHICDSKYGVFQSEKYKLSELALQLGLLSRDKHNISFARHPLAYLVEAADDICYLVIDLEDSVNLGWVSEDEAKGLLMPFLEKDEYFSPNKHGELKSISARMGYLRARAIGVLINEVTKVFLDNESKILEGMFSVSLLEESGFSGDVNNIKNISAEKIYRSEEVVEKEIAGHRILKTLLGVFVTAYIHKTEDRVSPYDELALKLLPKIESLDIYNGVMDICTFISGLTDGRVVALHKKITGMSF